MIKIISTLPTHIAALLSLKDKDKVLRFACVQGVSLILHRIQHDSKNSKGENLKPYSKQYAKIRIAAGRQVAKKDLTMTGQMTSNFKILPTGEKSYGLGFDNSFANQKAEWNEAREGTLFLPTKQENDVIVSAIQSKIIKILNKQSI